MPRAGNDEESGFWGKHHLIKLQDLGMPNRDYVVSNWLVRKGKEQGKQQNIVEELQGLRRMLVGCTTRIKE